MFKPKERARFTLVPGELGDPFGMRAMTICTDLGEGQIRSPWKVSLGKSKARVSSDLVPIP